MKKRRHYAEGSSNTSAFEPASREDFGAKARFEGRPGTKIDPYSASMEYNAPWGGQGIQGAKDPYKSGINDPRPTDPRVAADALMDKAASIQESQGYNRGTSRVSMSGLERSMYGHADKLHPVKRR